MEFELRKDDGIVIVKPQHALTEQDFAQLSAAVDPYLAESGILNALVIYTPDFPGWDSLAGLLSHIQFVKQHVANIRKVAFVTDSKLISVVPKFADLFVSAEIEHFPYSDYDQAIDWATTEA
jgi:hypothetical protein